MAQTLSWFSVVGRAQCCPSSHWKLLGSKFSAVSVASEMGVALPSGVHAPVLTSLGHLSVALAPGAHVPVNHQLLGTMSLWNLSQSIAETEGTWVSFILPQ